MDNEIDDDTIIFKNDREHIRYLKERKAQMKFDCLKLAFDINNSADSIVEKAKTFYKFIRT